MRVQIAQQIGPVSHPVVKEISAFLSVACPGATFERSGVDTDMPMSWVWIPGGCFQATDGYGMAQLIHDVAVIRGDEYTGVKGYDSHSIQLTTPQTAALAAAYSPIDERIRGLVRRSNLHWASKGGSVRFSHKNILRLAQHNLLMITADGQAAVLTGLGLYKLTLLGLVATSMSPSDID